MGDQLTKYTGFDMDMLDAVDKKVESISGSVFMDISPGTTVVRFLPAPAGKQPFRVTSMHYIDAVPGLDKLVVFACPRTELKQPCPACAEVDRLISTRNPVDKERAYRIEAKLKVYSNVIDRANPDAGARVLSMGKMLWGKLKEIRRNPRLGGDFTDPGAGGFDVVITREGSGKTDTRYDCAADRSNSPLAETAEEMDHMLSSQHDLEALVDTAFPDELLNAYRSLTTAGRGGSAGGRQDSAPRGSQVQPGRRSAVIDAQGTTVEDDADDPSKW